jgi:uncharacterized protein (DUF488 family)
VSEYSPEVVSVGYEGLSQTDLVARLVDAGVSILVDVRQTPISRKRGLSKTALGEALAAEGIHYLHLRELGNPRENREAYRQGDAQSRRRFRAILKTPPAQNALHRMSELVCEGTLGVLCFEHDHETCHRHQVIEELRAIQPDLQVTLA